MASCNLDYSGSTSVINAWATVTEKTTSGFTRSINLKVTVGAVDTTYDRDGKYAVSCDESGTNVSNQAYVCPGSGSTYTIFNETFSVTMNDDNVTADINFSFSANLYSPSAGTKTIKGTITTLTLTKTLLASTISSAGDVVLGSGCNITFVPLSTTYYYRLKFSLSDWSKTVNIGRPGITTSYQYTSYTIPLDVANKIPNSTTGKMYVSLYTYTNSSYSTQIGSASTSSFTVTVPDNIIPTIDTCTLSLDNSANDVVANWGIALAGYSRVHIDAAASGSYGSTISSFSISGSYRISLAGASLDYTGGIITSSGNKQFLITCTDSRGRVSTTYTSEIIAFMAYTAPKAKKLTMSKNSSGKMVATATWSYDSVGGRNSATAKMYYKTTSATDWTIHSGEMTNGVAFTLSSLTPDELLSYNFKVVVTDSLGHSSEKDAFSSTITVLLDFKAGGNGLGVGKICEEDGMEVSMETIFFNEVYIKNRETTLENYIRSVMKTISEEMFGDVDASAAIPNPSFGQIYFKRVT